MKNVGTNLLLSATDLASHLQCNHLTALNRAVSEGTLAAPPPLTDEVLEKLGLDHEQSYLEHLRSKGLTIRAHCDETETRDALHAGVDLVYQGRLVQPAASLFFVGHPDFLRRVERPSSLGAWSYEVYDTKLSLTPRASAVLQLCVYSELLSELQGVMPEHLHIVSPRPDFAADSFRLDDFLAYYRQTRRQFDHTLDASPPTYPEPVEHCSICRWWKRCDDQRHADDHLSLVAGMSRTQRHEMTRAGQTTLAAFAGVETLAKPPRGALASLQRVQRQALIQLHGRQSGALQHELIDAEPGRGLALLPAPSPGDVFLDLEGDGFVAEGGREYLFGMATRGHDGALHYTSYWGLTASDEVQAFERAMDFLIDRWARDPGMHVYHYAPYEPAAFKRLMGRTGRRADDVDRLLRAKRFVDLYTVVRQGVRCSVESYSIKRLEPFYNFTREVELPDASAALRTLEHALALGRDADITETITKRVETYNRDDCFSASRLRDWLEQCRSALISRGVAIARPTAVEGEPTEKLAARLAARKPVFDRLLHGMPADVASRSPEQQARYLLAHLLHWHWGEDKVKFWEKYRLQALPPEEIADEPLAIDGLEHIDRIDPTGKKKAVVDRYRYPAQELGFSWFLIKTEKAEATLLDFAQRVCDQAPPDRGLYSTAWQLLTRATPRLRDGSDLMRPGESPVESAVRVVNLLDDSMLAIQGPPGTGKTHTAAQMILAALNVGKRVGITANSHEVIRNLIDKVLELAPPDQTPRCMHKTTHELPPAPAIRMTDENKDVVKALADGNVDVVGGTFYLWARGELASTVDILFVDEAGQMSLANVLAASHAAKSLVLLGDPQQLEQPQKGSHPDGVGLSALEHLFAGEQTVRHGHGLLLDRTWRMAPAICRFTSELFYAGRLQSRPTLERQQLCGTTRFDGAGYFFVPVDHEGNRNHSEEEATTIVAIVEELLAPSARWTDSNSQIRPLTQADILVITPYNLQVRELQDRLTQWPNIRIGTVDKFQGKEAPVVIYSLATSTPEDAPRGMEFLYSLNRLNVATSRAKSTCILVASPRLFEPECKTPQQMRLANALCRYREMTVATSL